MNACQMTLDRVVDTLFLKSNQPFIIQYGLKPRKIADSKSQVTNNLNLGLHHIFIEGNQEPFNLILENKDNINIIFDDENDELAYVYTKNKLVSINSNTLTNILTQSKLVLQNALNNYSEKTILIIILK